MHFADQSVIAEVTATMLLEVKAVLFHESKPFVFTSGWASPVYIDCRKLIFYPRIRSQLVDFATATLARDAGFEQFDVVAGGETAGIPYAAWIADRLGLPMQYVRKKPKGFGRNAQIEGDIREGARTLLVEDLTTDGRSKINFCKALRDAGAVVEHVFVNFYYDIFPESKKTLRRPERDACTTSPPGGTCSTVVKKGGYLEAGADRGGREVPARARQVVGRARRRLELSALSLRVITLNVNGIRSARRTRACSAGSPTQRADVVCLQELKCHEADLDAKLHGLKAFETCHAFAEKKGYSGVALYSRSDARRGAPRLRGARVRRRGPLRRGALRQAVGDLALPALGLGRPAPPGVEVPLPEAVSASSEEAESSEAAKSSCAATGTSRTTRST